MIEKLKRLRAWLMSPVGKVFILGVGVSLVMLALGYRRQVYSSDDVVWQNALLTWVPFHKNIYYSDGSASFIAKVPLYLLIGKIIAPSRLALLVASAFLTAGNFALCYFIIIGFLKRAKVHLTLLTLLPFVWVASLGWQFETLFLMPNVHNIEVGFVLLMYAAAVKVAAREVDFRKSRRAVVWAAVLCLLFGLFILDDQYVLYFGVAPVVGLGIYLLARHRTKDSLIILGGSVLSVAFAHVFHLMAAMAGVQLPAGVPVSFASFPMFVSNIGTTVESLLMVFDADFWGRKVVGFTTVSMMFNAGILAVVVIAVGRTLRRSKILWLTLLAGVFVFALAVYATSDLSIGTSTYRYLVLLPFIAIPFLSMQLEGGYSDLKRIFAGLLAASILLNVLVGIVGAHENLASPPNNSGNRQNLALVQALKERGLTKGYAQYWDANINSYLSGGSVLVVPVLCSPDALKPMTWLVPTSEINRTATRTFLILDPAHPEDGCTEDGVEHILGSPSSSFMAAGMTVIVYDRDIAKL